MTTEDDGGTVIPFAPRPPKPPSLFPIYLCECGESWFTTVVSFQRRHDAHPSDGYRPRAYVTGGPLATHPGPTCIKCGKVQDPNEPRNPGPVAQ